VVVPKRFRYVAERFILHQRTVNSNEFWMSADSAGSWHLFRSMNSRIYVRGAQRIKRGAQTPHFERRSYFENWDCFNCDLFCQREKRFATFRIPPRFRNRVHIRQLAIRPRASKRLRNQLLTADKPVLGRNASRVPKSPMQE
jgi:hypothetical protein